MAQKKNYSRYFIILQEDEKGYAIAHDKLPTGYVKLELKNDKCKVSYYVQNLKREHAPYYMILILSRKDTNKIMKLGELNIDDYGRADVSYEYLSNDIGNTGMSIDNVSGAAVVKLLDKNIISVLNGFLTTDIPKWREFELIEPKLNKEHIEKKSEKSNSKNESSKDEGKDNRGNVFEEYENNIEELKKKDNDDNVDDKFDADKEIEERINEEENINLKPSNIEEKHKEENKETYTQKDLSYDNNAEELNNLQTNDYNSEGLYIADSSVNNDNEYRKEEFNSLVTQREMFFNHIVEEFQDVSGKIKDIKRCKWFKVPIEDAMDMYSIHDYNKYTVLYYPMMSYYRYIELYKHFLIGYKFDKKMKIKYIIYGIPGTKDLKDQPFKGKTGFVTWVPTKDQGSCNGYWLMFYDFENSTIVIPQK